MTRLARTAFSAAVLAAVMSAPAFAASTEEFVKKASATNMFELESSKLALERASQDEVRAFAQKMVEDHEKVGEKMEALLKKEKLEDRAAKELDDRHSAVMHRLRNAAGAGFDEEYVEAQEKAHEEAIALFTDYAKDGDNAALKTFAKDALPGLRTHKEHAEKLDKPEAE